MVGLLRWCRVRELKNDFGICIISISMVEGVSMYENSLL